MKDKILYCAYGSNINMAQMQKRCPEASVVGIGYIEGYELEFNTVANIVKKKGAKVPAVLWKLSPKDVASLDTYEGYPHKYVKQVVDVTIGNNEHFNAMVYTRRGTPKIEPPSQEYYERIETGYKDFGLNLQYLEEAYDYSVEMYQEPFDYYETFGYGYEKTYPKASDTELLKAFIAGEQYSRLGFEKTTLEEKAMIAKLIIKEYKGEIEAFEKYCNDFFQSFLDVPFETVEYKKYVAYGSNMNIKDMKKRCPNSKIVDVGRLENYELKFNHCLTIKENKNEYTPVVVWDIHPNDWKALDAYEGYPGYYRRDEVHVNVKGRKIPATAYIMNVSDNIYSPPSKLYYETVKQGYIENNISLTKLNQALTKSQNKQNSSELLYKTTRKR